MLVEVGTIRSFARRTVHSNASYDVLSQMLLVGRSALLQSIAGAKVLTATSRVSVVSPFLVWMALKIRGRFSDSNRTVNWGISHVLICIACLWPSLPRRGRCNGTSLRTVDDSTDDGVDLAASRDLRASASYELILGRLEGASDGRLRSDARA